MRTLPTLKQSLERLCRGLGLMGALTVSLSLPFAGLPSTGQSLDGVADRDRMHARL
jgi:hypothetical protein